MGVSSFGAQGTNAHAILAHKHSWTLERSSIGSSTAAAPAGSGLQQQQQHRFVFQGQRFWVAPMYQRLISRALITRPERSRRASGLKVAFEARLDAPGLADLWAYLSPPAGPGQAAQPYLSNSILLAAAASAGSLLATQGGGAAGQDQALVLQSAVLAPPQQLPAYPGQPGVQLPTLLVACTVATGGCVIEVAGQRQLQCVLAVVGAAEAAAAEGNAPEQQQQSGDGQAASTSLSSRLQALLGSSLAAVTAAAAAAAAAAPSAPAALVGAQHKHLDLQAVAGLSFSGSNDGYVLHPAGLEASLQSCMVTTDQATGLWLSTVQALTVPLATASADAAGASPRASSWVAASCAQAVDGSSCQVHSLSLFGPTGHSTLALTGALLAADAATATEVAAATAEAAAGVTSKGAAAAALSAVTAAANPLLQLDEAERALYLQAQIMSEVGCWPSKVGLIVRECEYGALNGCRRIPLWVSESQQHTMQLSPV
jgi:hypothetical protein